MDSLYKTPYQLGKNAYRQGQPCDAPFPHHTKQEDDWYQGWWDARQDDGKSPATYGKESK